MIANLDLPTNTRATRNAVPKTAKKVRTQKKPCRTVAKIIGGVAATLVFLSVWHLTCATATLTGSPIVLALFLAIGIDLGLISSELAELVAHGNRQVAKWARGYMALATVLSMILNAYEFAAHAPEGMLTKGLAIGFGLLLPVMIFILARIAAHLWQSK